MKYIDLSKHADSAYRIAELIDSSFYDNVLVYEFHNHIAGSLYDNYEKGLESFRERSEEYYSSFIPQYLADGFASIIGVAVKISNEWVVVEDAGSNFYLGYGPGGILELRKSCFKRGVKIFYFSDVTIQDWMQEMGFTRESTRINNKKAKNKVSDAEAKYFKKIVNAFAYYTNAMQSDRIAYQNIGEETIRDKMMPSLAGIFQGQASAETKKGKGYTDILITSKKYPLEFIFELKKWKGPRSINETLQQLKGYLGHHNNYVGIIFYCYNKDFTSIIQSAEKQLKGDYRLEEMDDSQQQLRVIVNDESDSQKKITVHIFFINLFTTL